MNVLTHIRSKAGSAVKRRRRGSIALEAVLVFPVILITFSAVAQVLLLAQARSFVEQAAYAAGRSALVHKCKDYVSSELLYTAYERQNCSDNPQIWEDAARWALVPASEFGGFALARNECPSIDAGLAAIRAHSGFNGKAAAIENAICYAFEPGNVTVEADWNSQGLSGSSPFASKPIRATVTFKAPVSTPFRRFVADGKRGDGTRWREITASVVLM